MPARMKQPTGSHLGPERRHQALALLAGATGTHSEFLHTAAEALSLGLDCMLVGIGEADQERTKVDLRVLLKDGEFRTPYTYDLAGTPCEEVYTISGTEPHVCHSAGLCGLFPEDAALVTLGAEGYRAEVFHDPDGNRIGHVFIIDNKTLDGDPDDTAFFRLISQRVGAEVNRWRADRARRESDQILQSLLDNSPAIIGIRDTDGRFLLVNKAYEEYLGIGAGMAHHKDIAAVVPKAVADDLLAYDNGVIETGEPMIHEHTANLMAEGGRVLTARFPIRNDRGEIVAIGAIGTDVTEMRRTEERLAVQDERYERATLAGRVGVWEWDLEAGEVYFAPNLEKMLGCATDEHIRHIDQWLARVEPSVAETMMNDVAAYRRGDRIDESIIEYSVTLPNGTIRWFEARAHPIFDDSGKAVKLVGTDTDITERKEIEVQLIAAKEAAEDASRIKSEFLATMSHEFRTPLNAIIGFSDMMRLGSMGVMEIETYKDYANDIHQSGRHMLELVNDVLDIAAIEAGERRIWKTNLAIADILLQGIKSVEAAAAEKGLDISLSPAADLPALHADERSLTQIVNNLLSNAVKFTGPGGRISVSADLGVDMQSFVVVFADTGIGISPDQLRDITKPFSQVHANPHLAEHGTGLGLAIVESLIHAHDGSLNIDSQPGQGTIVTVRLPNAPPGLPLAD